MVKSLPSFLHERTRSLTHLGIFHVKYHTWVIRDSIVRQGHSTRQVTESLCVLSVCVWLAALMMVISCPRRVQDSCHCLICLTDRGYCCESRQIHTPSVCVYVFEDLCYGVYLVIKEFGLKNWMSQSSVAWPGCYCWVVIWFNCLLF